MSDKPIEVSYNTSFGDLVRVLSNVRRPGDFFATGKMKASMPSLKIEGVGRIAFPVLPVQAKEIIAQAAERAPYGKGEETLVDENVRKVWQVAPAKVTLEGKGWVTIFDHLVAQIANAMGCQGSKVSAEFYKLLVYDTGGFFATHRDSEKAGGMFGTLVIALPSEHEGGTLFVRHQGREVAIDLRGSDLEEIGYAAFYADCEHEVHPITAGYRVCLIYNLIQKTQSGESTLTAPDYRNTVTDCAQKLKNWTSKNEEEDSPAKLVYLLEHRYTEAALSFKSLKNADAALAKVLKEAAAQADCALHLALVHIEESGWAEHDEDYSRRRRRSRYDDDDDPSSYEIGEVDDSSCYLDQWHDLDDNTLDFGEVPLNQEELLPPSALDNEKPDELHFSEATGNEGASFERAYLRAALVLWPKKGFDDICLSVGIEAGLARLGELIKENDIEAATQLIQKIIVSTSWSKVRVYDKNRLVIELLTYVTQIGNLDLIEEIFTPFSFAVNHYNGSQNKIIAACLRLLGLPRSGPLLLNLVECYGSSHFDYIVDLWVSLSEQSGESSKELTAMATALVEKIPDCRLSESDPSVSLNSGLLLKAAKECGLWAMPQLMKYFLLQLHARGLNSLTTKAVKSIITHKTVFEPEQLLLPMLEGLVDSTNRQQRPFEKSKPTFNPDDLQLLWSSLAAIFLPRGERPPTEPADWAQAIKLSCKCQECRELEKFANDPLKTTYHFRMSEGSRCHLESEIKNQHLDMSCVTNREGRPYTLICVKTRASYERACKRYQEDLTILRRLIALATSGCPPKERVLIDMKNVCDKI